MATTVKSRGKTELVLDDAARLLVQKLNKEIADGHDSVAFMLAILLAIMKDGLDFILDILGVGLIPILGQIPGYFLSAFLMVFLWGKGYFLKGKIKIIYWIFGLFFDNLPAFNALPLNTLTVIYAWHVVRKRAGKAREKLDDVKKLTEQEVEDLNNDISLLDKE